MAPVMAAIALAESSGNPNAKNPHDNNGRQTSWGLWQISDGTHNEPVPNILDPKINAQQAVKKLSVQGLGAWGTYGGVRYKQYLAQNTGTPPDMNGLPTGSTSTTNATPVDDITGDIGGAIGEGFAMAFKAVMQPVIATMLWGGEIMLGIALMTGGVIVFIMNTNAGKRATNEATSIAGTAASVAAPEVAPELMAASRLRSAEGRRQAVRRQAREAARKSPAGQRVQADRRKARIQAEQKRQSERKAIRQEAKRRNDGQRGSSNSQG